MTGNKDALISRLETLPPVAVNLVSVLLEKWFMKPIRSSYFKFGSSNEPNILRSLNEFLRSDASQGYSLEGPPVCCGLSKEDDS